MCVSSKNDGLMMGGWVGGIAIGCLMGWLNVLLVGVLCRAMRRRALGGQQTTKQPCGGSLLLNSVFVVVKQCALNAPACRLPPAANSPPPPTTDYLTISATSTAIYRPPQRSFTLCCCS